MKKLKLGLYSVFIWQYSSSVKWFLIYVVPQVWECLLNLSQEMQTEKDNYCHPAEEEGVN